MLLKFTMQCNGAYIQKTKDPAFHSYWYNAAARYYEMFMLYYILSIGLQALYVYT